MSSQSEEARRVAEARAAVTASLNSVGASADAEMRYRAKDLHSNATAISKQEKELSKQTAMLAKESAKWQKLADTSTKKLNEIGDLQNWAEMIERDLLVVEETLRLVDGKSSSTSASGTGK
jgi:hypothetical protein